MYLFGKPIFCQKQPVTKALDGVLFRAQRGERLGQSVVHRDGGIQPAQAGVTPGLTVAVLGDWFPLDMEKDGNTASGLSRGSDTNTALKGTLKILRDHKIKPKGLYPFGLGGDGFVQGIAKAIGPASVDAVNLAAKTAASDGYLVKAAVGIKGKLKGIAFAWE